MARPRGFHLNPDAFEFVLTNRGFSRSQVAAAAQIKLTFLSDLCAGRSGASNGTAKAIADALSVRPGVLFPEILGWGAPERTLRPAVA